MPIRGVQICEVGEMYEPTEAGNQPECQKNML